MALHAKGKEDVVLNDEPNMPAYRVLGVETREIRRLVAGLVSHEGHYP